MFEQNEKCSFVIRSAGSKGKVDLAVFWQGGEVWLVQCKLRGTISDKERHELGQLGARTGHIPIIAYRKVRSQQVWLRELDEAGGYAAEEEPWP
jgi:hypothetical protein